MVATVSRASWHGGTGVGANPALHIRSSMFLSAVSFFFRGAFSVAFWETMSVQPSLNKPL